MRILVADDEPITRKLVVSILTKAGHTVEAFEDGQALWEGHKRDPAPLIVSDWLMPRLKGVEVCQKIRKERLSPYTHVILVTSMSSTEHMITAFRAGVDDFMAKPIDRDLLTLRVAAAERGTLAQAETAMRKCLEICQSSLGPEHAGLLTALEELTAVSREQRAYVRCRAFLRRQVEIATKTFGEHDARTVSLLNQLAELSSLEEVF